MREGDFFLQRKMFFRTGEKILGSREDYWDRKTNRKRKFSEWDRINPDKVWPSRKKSLFLQTKLR